ncbi:MAG TPA: UDP-glucose 4-epimerase GalE [Nevskiaceae bacterium]|nr:UDP-glucose 4-epimerase GalE [Nevskiaceae bacterium]
MRALVVGGAGYIGSHMLRCLLRAGHQACVYDDLSTGHAAAVAGAELVQGDLGDRAQIGAVLERFQPEVVLHFAARSVVAESMADPGLYYRDNVGHSLVLLEEMRRTGVQRLIFSSTAAVYGNPRQVPIDEDHPLLPINPYGWSKLFTERMIQDHCRAYGLRAISLRYFNAAGADESGELGEAHEPETHLIPNILRVAAGQAEVIRIYGQDHDTADGSCVRDYVHVSDLCNAHLSAAERLADPHLPAFQTFNLGIGHGFSVLEVLRAAEAVVGRALPQQRMPRRPGDPPILVASAKRARAALGWRPRYTDLHQIVDSAWRWHRQPRY